MTTLKSYFYYFSRPLGLLMLAALAASVMAAVVLTSPAWAASFAVTKTADTNDGACNSDCSLREAIVAANAASDVDTITLPAGTYQFSRTGNDDTAALGDLDITNPVTINGAGAGTTTIDGQDADRVFDIAPVSACACTVNFSGLTITNGSANANNFNVGGAIYMGSGVTMSISNSTVSSSTASNSGAGIEARGASLTLNNVTFQNNDALSSGGAVRSIGNLTISGSTFQNNEAEFGGAIALAQDNTKSMSISGSRFTGNHTAATTGGNADDGGAIYADIDPTLTLTGNTFTGNSSVNNGGAIFMRDNTTTGTGTLNAGFNRIVGNSAVAGNGLYRESGTVTAEKNWWGCNAGSSVAPCDRVSGTVDSDPWIVLSHTASSTNIQTGQSTTLTADFLKNSDGSSNLASNLGGLAGTPITFGNAVLGTISNAQTTIQSNGAATATYTAGSTAGSGHADATVDNQTVTTADITITRPATTVTSIDRSDSSPTNANSVSWTVVFANAVSGLSASNFDLVNGGLGGTPNITALTPVGSAPATNWTVTASTGSGNGTLGLKLVNETGLSHSVSNLPFTGQVYTIDKTAPDTTIDSSPSDPSTSDSAKFSFSGTDSGTGVASFECKLDAGSFAACTSEQSYSVLSDGSHTFQVRAIDGVGNVDPSPASFTWTVDTAAPGTTIDSSPSDPSTSDSAKFSFSGTDSGTGVASFECKLDAGSFAACTSPQNYSSLADESHTFQVRAIDGVGNMDASPASFTWTVDATAPTVTIEQASGQDDPTSTSPINFTVTFDSPVSGFTTSDVTLSGTAGATTAVVTESAPNDGTTYNVGVSGMTSDGTVVASIPANAAQDAAGNGSSASTSTDNTVTFNLNSSPTATVTNGQCSTTNTASGTINLTLNDPNGDAMTLTFASNSNTALVPNANIALGGSGNNRTISVTVAPRKSGSATLTFNLSDGTVTVPVVITVVAGSDKNDTLTGTAGSDMIFGKNGDDTINAGNGNDLACGGNGNDTLKGQGDNDILSGGLRNDRLEGGDGDDTLTGGLGADSFSGGSGTDTVTDYNTSERDTKDNTIP